MHRKHRRRLKRDNVADRPRLTKSDIALEQVASTVFGTHGTHIALDWAAHDDTLYITALAQHFDNDDTLTHVTQTSDTTTTTNPTETRVNAARVAAQALNNVTKTTTLALHVPSRPLFDVLIAGTDTTEWTTNYQRPYQITKSHDPAIQLLPRPDNPATAVVRRGPYTEHNDHWNATKSITVAQPAQQKTHRMMSLPLVRCITANAVLGRHPIIYQETNTGRYHALHRDYAVVIDVEPNYVVVTTQMHQHPDYAHDDTYRLVDRVNNDAVAMTLADDV